MMKGLFLILALVVAEGVSTEEQKISIDAGNRANPIRKVVTMLESISKKVEAEGEVEEKLFNKFMCYCKNSGGDLTKGLDAAGVKIPELVSSIEAAKSQKVQLQDDLTTHRSDREAAKKNMAEATKIREKDAASFAAMKAEADANIKALNSAVAAVEKGMAGAFLQTGSGNRLRNMVQSIQDMSDASRETITAFLATSSSEDLPSSGEITGVLKQLGERMEKDLADATATEEAAVKDYDGLIAAKTKEVDACTAAIEDKTIRVGEVAVSIANMENDLTDTQAAAVEDKKFLADLEKNCKTKQAEWDSIVKARSEELVALAETVKLLNDDDALELFKKALPSAASASLVQIQVSERNTRARALAMIRAAASAGTSRPARQELDFIALAIHGKKIGFEKVIAMVDAMKKTLQKEQVDDDNKKEYCGIQLDSLDDKKKAAERSVSDSEKAIADAKESIETLTADIAALSDGIKALDKSVVEATEQRKTENEDFSTLMAQNTAAVELIGVAKNRLNKFYSPKLYVPPPKRELSEEDRIAVNMGGTAPPTPAPGGIAGTGITYLAQVSEHGKVAPPAAPEAPGPFKKNEGSSGVIAMMDLLIKDLEKEMTIAKTEEKDAQADYESMLKDSGDKRAADSKSLSENGAAKADAEEALENHEDSKSSSTSELMATVQVIHQLHGECDWLLQYFDARKEARTAEIDALTKAKAVLNGADFSLLQTAAVAKNLRGNM